MHQPFAVARAPMQRMPCILVCLWISHKAWEILLLSLMLTGTKEWTREGSGVAEHTHNDVIYKLNYIYFKSERRTEEYLSFRSTQGNWVVLIAPETIHISFWSTVSNQKTWALIVILVHSIPLSDTWGPILAKHFHCKHFSTLPIIFFLFKPEQLRVCSKPKVSVFYAILEREKYIQLSPRFSNSTPRPLHRCAAKLNK